MIQSAQSMINKGEKKAYKIQAGYYAHTFLHDEFMETITSSSPQAFLTFSSYLHFDLTNCGSL